jgi:type II secretory pathway pseudopilin PulG
VKRPLVGCAPPARDEGLSLVEVLVAMGLFSVLGTLLLGLALSTSQVTEDTRDLASVGEQSRLAMERITRELRQAEAVLAVHLPQSASDTTAITFWTDFDGDNVKNVSAADPEVMTYRWDPQTGELTLTANDASGTAVTRPMLAVNVTGFVLGLRSSKWQYDKSADSVPTTWQELDDAGAPVGNKNLVADGPELENIDLLDLAMTVTKGSHAQTYTTQVDLRNRE